ncbi:hypothetical protein [Kitasatospora herbaricolor]|uniref:Uncharacterized protein n=1 Tax=Kitasatospora herbaricolor TaxID=68217 RepID=A0ABZ1WJG7_9ACTN|nr:hypothetical protein [Kitasatospora herbaricolor]
MTFTMSAVLFFGVVLGVLVRSRQTTGIAACVAVAFGFLLASTDFAPAIHDLLSRAVSLSQ